MKELSLMMISAFAFVVCLALSAADVQVEPEMDASLKVWESFGPESKFIQMAARTFEEKYKKYNVKVETSEVETAKSVDKMQIAVQGGMGADVFVFGHDRLGQAINSGIIMPDLVSADRIANDFMTAAVGAAKGPDGKIYGFPLSIETYALFYNKKLFSEPPLTVEALMKKGKELTDKAKSRYGLYFDLGSFYFSYAFIAMDGGYVFGKNGYDVNDIGLNNGDAVKGLESLISLRPISTDNAPEKDQANAAMLGLFTEGKVGAVITGPWSVEAVKKGGVDFAICPLPTFNGKHPVSFSGVRLMGVNPSSKFKKAAQLFAAFCTSDEMLLKRYEMTCQIPPVKALLNNKAISENPIVKPFLEQAAYAQPMPSVPEMNLVWDPMYVAVSDAWAGKMAPKEALDKAVTVIRQQMTLKK